MQENIIMAIRYQRAACLGALTTLTLLQDSGEKVLQETIHHLPWLADDGKAVCSAWFDACKMTALNMKTTIDGNFQSLEKTVTDFHLQPAVQKVKAEVNESSAEVLMEKPAVAKMVETKKKVAPKKSAKTQSAQGKRKRIVASSSVKSTVKKNDQVVKKQ